MMEVSYKLVDFLTCRELPSLPRPLSPALPLPHIHHFYLFLYIYLSPDPCLIYTCLSHFAFCTRVHTFLAQEDQEQCVSFSSLLFCFLHPPFLLLYRTARTAEDASPTSQSPVEELVLVLEVNVMSQMYRAVCTGSVFFWRRKSNLPFLFPFLLRGTQCQRWLSPMVCTFLNPM